jgi:hypothetical protein
MDRVICMRASADAGASWGPLQANLSRGNACYPTSLWDPKTKSVVLQFSTWPSDSYYRPTPMQVVSTDNGNSFSAPELVFPGAKEQPALFLGSCRGAVIPSGEHSGRLVFAGYNHSLPKDTISHTFVWYSDQGGRTGTWQRSLTEVQYMAETQVAVLPGGTEVALYGRSNTQDHCRCQNTALSTDGGASFSQSINLTSLPSPNCQGSVLFAGIGDVAAAPGANLAVTRRPLGYYSGPNSAERQNMTIFETNDRAGRVWVPSRQVAATPTEAGMYSCIEDIAADASAARSGATTGLLWETSLRFSGDADAAYRPCTGAGCNIVFTSF